MAIHSIEVPKQNWASFLQVLNRMAQDRLVSLEVLNRELGDEEMASKLPLEAIDFETKGSDRGDILVTVLSDDGPLTHRIEKPTQFFVAHNDAGDLLQTVAVLDAAGGETIVHFEDVPALPEQTGADASA